jgi:hypothetical protein
VYSVSWDSSFGIAISYGLGWQGLIPVRGKRFFCTAVSKLALGPTQPYIQWALETVSLGVKRPGLEADHSLQSTAKVKMVDLYLHSPICLHGIVLN